MHLREELEKRGFLYQYTNEEVFTLYDGGQNTLYVGMDPTADSLHLGNFVGFMHAVQWMKRGNHLIFIVGGATGMIGDPGGKNSERSFLDEVTLTHNVQAITKQVGDILENLSLLSGEKFSWEVRNNLEMYEGMSYLRFLREVGKYITVNQMLTKETVKRRIEDPESSISYTEFSYMLMQAYDFLQLYLQKGCQLQIAGSDQRGNIVTGVELIRKKCDVEVYGVTCPLIVDSTGKKFGKSEGNALWLDPQKNSPFVLFQYFMNTADEDVSRYLHLLTLLTFDEIGKIIDEHHKDPSKRTGQYQLAYYVTKTVFGKQAADHAEQITELLFGSADKVEKISHMDDATLKALHEATGKATSSSTSLRILEACVLAGLVDSNAEAKKAIASGAIFLNEQPVQEISYQLSPTDFLGGKLALLRKGKKQYATILLT